MFEVTWAGEGAARAGPPWLVGACPAVRCDSVSRVTVHG